MGYNEISEISDRSWIATLLLAIFLPGIHRFYVGKIGTGILFWLTAGGCGFWYVIDIVMILFDAFRDKQGRKLRK